MYEVLILLVLVNLGFTSYIWRTVRRSPKRKFLGKLLNGNPITPNHTSTLLLSGIELGMTHEDHGSSPISRCLPMLKTTGSSQTSHGGCKNDLTLNSQAARKQSTVVATRFL